MSRTQSVIAVALLGLALAACQPGGSGQPAASSPTATVAPGGRPTAIANAKVVTGRVICPLESVNGRQVRESRAFTISSKATLVGWSTVADHDHPVPPMATIVFRSLVPDGSGDLFWPGMRVARPELSPEPRLRDAGYSASGSFPSRPGRYKVLVWVGDGQLQRECDTKEVFDIHG
jgi:hypothetical protein